MDDNDDDGNRSSAESDLSYSAVLLESPVLPYIPRRYDRSLIVPSVLSERRANPHSLNIQLPPVKTFIAGSLSEEDDFLAMSPPTTERELTFFKQKFNRLRVTLSKSHESGLYTCEKVRQKRSDLRGAVRDQRKLIEQLVRESSEINNKIQELRDEISKQCHKRDAHELKQLKLRSTLNRHNAVKDQFAEMIMAREKSHEVEEYKTRLEQLEIECRDELADRDRQIQELKRQLVEKFDCRANERKKVIRTTEQACTIESQKCEKLQEFVDDYEANVYRSKKPCCVSTSYRLSKLSTQLRLYSIIESALHELFHSSCSCGSFRRCHQTFMRTHPK